MAASRRWNGPGAGSANCTPPCAAPTRTAPSSAWTSRNSCYGCTVPRSAPTPTSPAVPGYRWPVVSLTPSWTSSAAPPPLSASTRLRCRVPSPGWRSTTRGCGRDCGPSPRPGRRCCARSTRWQFPCPICHCGWSPPPSARWASPPCPAGRAGCTGSRPAHWPTWRPRPPSGRCTPVPATAPPTGGQRGTGGTFQELITGSSCSVPSVLRVPVSSRNSRPAAGSRRSQRAVSTRSR